MFRKRTLLFGALALTLVASQAFAEKGDVTATIGGGAEVPVDQTGASVGFMGGGDLDYATSEAVCIGADVAFYRQRFTGGGSSNLMSGGGHVKYMYSMSGESKMSPYVVVGGGIYHATGLNKAGGRGGVGMNYKSSGNLSINVEGNFHVIATTGAKTKFGTVRGGVTFPLTSK